MSSVFALFLYCSILCGIGWFSKRSAASESSYVLGNRGLSYWVTALSAHASDMSIWLFMGLPGAVYSKGLGSGWIAVGLLLGMFANWTFIARKLRVATELTHSYTLSTYLGRHFRDHHRIIRRLTGLFSLYFLIVYLTSGVVGIGFLLETLFGVPYHVGILVVMPLLISYVFVGGYKTVAWIDFFQGSFLLCVIAAVPLYALYHIGGFETVVASAAQKGISLSLWNMSLPKEGVSSLLFGLGWGLGYFGQPHILTKFMGIRNPREVVKSRRVGMWWQTLALLFAVMAGVVAIGFFPGILGRPELAFIEMTRDLFPPFVATFLLCGIIAAALSTMDSQMLVAGSILSEDMVRQKDGGLDQRLLWVTKGGVVLIGAIATGCALYFQDKTVLDLVTYAWSGLGSTFGPIVIASLYLPQVSRPAAIAGACVGGATAMFWPWFEAVFLGNIGLIPILPAFGLSWMVMGIVTLYIPKPRGL